MENPSNLSPGHQTLQIMAKIVNISGFSSSITILEMSKILLEKLKTELSLVQTIQIINLVKDIKTKYNLVN